MTVSLMESESIGAQGNWLRVLADGRLEGDPALLFDHEQIVEEAIAALRDRYEVLSENLRARHAGLVDGVAPERVNALRQAAFDHTRPAVRVAVEERIAHEEERASTILVMRVEPSGSLHTLTNDTTYLRVGDESRKLTAAQRLELTYDRGAAAFEGSPTQLTINQLDADQMGSYAGVLGLADHRSMLLARDLLDRRGRVTVAACLLFDHRPQRDYPHAVVRVLRYGDAAAGVGSGMTLEDGADVRFDSSRPHRVFPVTPGWRRL